MNSFTCCALPPANTQYPPSSALIRKPRRGNTVNLSPLRPLVPAKERLSCWSTPFSLRHKLSNSSLFSPESHQHLLDVALASLAPNTRSTYAAGLLRFSQFCDKHKIDEDLRMPASSNLLSMFLAESAAGSVSLDCANNWLAGLHFWHNLHGAPWYGSTDQIDTLTKGVKKLVPPNSRRPLRSPVTMVHMYALRHALSPTNSKDVAMLALAEATFWGTCRLGEMVPPSLRTFDPAYHVTKGVSVTQDISRSNVPFLVFHIPWSKTTGFEGADINLVARDDLSNPTQSFLWHRHVNSSVPEDAPLFAYETSDGGWGAWTRDTFLTACNLIWSAAGLETLHGHSFRIGNTTELLLQGFEPAIVAVKGRWKSRASFMRYWRKIQEILPSFLSKDDNATLLRLQASFNAYEGSKSPL